MYMSIKQPLYVTSLISRFVSYVCKKNLVITLLQLSNVVYSGVNLDEMVVFSGVFDYVSKCRASAFVNTIVNDMTRGFRLYQH